jgi:hypothetical protein
VHVDTAGLNTLRLSNSAAESNLQQQYAALEADIRRKNEEAKRKNEEKQRSRDRREAERAERTERENEEKQRSRESREAEIAERTGRALTPMRVAACREKFDAEFPISNEGHHRSKSGYFGVKLGKEKGYVADAPGLASPTYSSEFEYQSKTYRVDGRFSDAKNAAMYTDLVLRANSMEKRTNFLREDEDGTKNNAAGFACVSEKEYRFDYA